jgi:hypothetical protein
VRRVSGIIEADGTASVVMVMGKKEVGYSSTSTSAYDLLDSGSGYFNQLRLSAWAAFSFPSVAVWTARLADSTVIAQTERLYCPVYHLPISVSTI